MGAAGGGHEACVQALLQRKAKTELLDGNGRTARWWAEATGQTATAELIRQHAAPPQPAPGKPAMSSSPAQLPAKIFHACVAVWRICANVTSLSPLETVAAGERHTHWHACGEGGPGGEPEIPSKSPPAGRAIQ